MTAIERAIRDAEKKGGWKWPQETKWVGGKLAEWVLDHWRLIAWQEIFLDPTFWQCLGKARGWEEHKKEDCDCAHIGEYCYMSYWELFIHHLADGKDAETFFAKL